jgi:hypothetical protein
MTENRYDRLDNETIRLIKECQALREFSRRLRQENEMRRHGGKPISSDLQHTDQTSVTEIQETQP